MVWINRGKVPVALTIAGSDSGGGAGIEADLKSFAAVGVHGTVAITAITAQNTVEVRRIQEIDLDVIRSQIEAVADDIGVDAAKTGMLYSSRVIQVVAESVEEYGFPLVVDPVIIAKSGARLLKEEAIETLIERLIPLATVVTPNRFEAEEISGVKITCLAEASEAARRIKRMGPKVVVVKGGHIGREESADVICYDEGLRTISTPRIDTNTTHGTGCSFSAFIAGLIARGYEEVEAVEEAKRLIYEAIKFGIPVGRGHGPVNPMAEIYKESEKWRCYVQLMEAYRRLRKSPKIGEAVPEVRMNIVYALPYAEDVSDVYGFPGRLTFVEGELRYLSPPAPGGSSHMARAVLEYMKKYPEIRSCMNIRFDSRIVEAARKTGFKVGYFSRSEEPKEIREREGGSIPWGVRTTLERMNMRLDVIYDEGGLGREPMIRIFGKDPLETVKKTLKILDEAFK